jgi:hypothetical protein
MRYFIVFPARHWKNVMGEHGISWDDAIGVFKAETPEDACLAAAKKAQSMSTLFAVEGFAWGLDMEADPNTVELGAKKDPMARLEQMGDRIARQLEAVAGNIAGQLVEGDAEDE